MSPNGGASSDQPGKPGKKYLIVTDQPSRMVVVRSVSPELDAAWRLMFIEYVEVRADRGLVSEITVGTGFAYVTYGGYGEQAVENRRLVLELINEVVPLIDPSKLALWIEQRNVKPAHA